MRTQRITQLSWRIALVFALAAVALSPPRAVRAHGPADERITALTVAIACEPGDVDLVLERAHLYREIGEPTRALTDYDRALRIDPTCGAHLGRALVLLELRRFADALAAADAAIDLGPNDARAWRARAQAQEGLNRTTDAIAALDQAIARADTPSPDDYLQRAQLLSSLEPSQLDDAIAGLDEGLARLGPSVALQRLAIDLEWQRGTFDAALARVDELETHYDRVETMLVLRGDILAQAGRELEAEVAYTEALQAIEQRIAKGRAAPGAMQLRVDLLRKLGGEAP